MQYIFCYGRYVEYYGGWNFMTASCWFSDYGGEGGPAKLIIEKRIVKPPTHHIPHGTRQLDDGTELDPLEWGWY